MGVPDTTESVNVVDPLLPLKFNNKIVLVNDVSMFAVANGVPADAVAVRNVPEPVTVTVPVTKGTAE